MSKLEYGVIVSITAELYVDGHYAGSVEGFALSEASSPDLMDVHLIDDRGGPGHYLKRNDQNLDTCSVSRALWKEAKSQSTADRLREEWNEKFYRPMPAVHEHSTYIGKP